MKPDLPTNCREHANGRVKAIERHYVDDELGYEFATFLCGCTARVYLLGKTWLLSETTYWKEGQA